MLCAKLALQRIQHAILVARVCWGRSARSHGAADGTHDAAVRQLMRAIKNIRTWNDEFELHRPAMSQSNWCAVAGCAKIATGRMVHEQSGSHVAYVCSEACGAALIGAPKRAAEEDDADEHENADKRPAERVDPRAVIETQLRYAHALATCYEIYSLLYGAMDVEAYGFADNGYIQFAIAKTLTIGSRITSGQEAQRRLNELMGELIAALATMHAGLSPKDVDIETQIRKIRDGLAEELTLEAFDAITNRFLLNPAAVRDPVVEDVRRLMAMRTNAVQVLARRDPGKLRFDPDDVGFDYGNPAFTHHMILWTAESKIIFDESLTMTSAMRAGTRTFHHTYFQSVIDRDEDSIKIDFSTNMGMAWKISRAQTVRFYDGYNKKITARTLAVHDLNGIWKVGENTLCGCYAQPGNKSRVVVFAMQDDRIAESFFDIDGAIHDLAIDSDGFLWMSKPDRIVAYTQAGVEVGFIALDLTSARAALYWAEKEGVWIVRYTSVSSKPGSIDHVVEEMMRARVAPWKADAPSQ